MRFKNTSQRKAVMAKMSIWQRMRQMPQQYQQFKHKREIIAEHKLAKEEKTTEQELTKEQNALEKQLSFEKRRLALQKEREELSKIKHERFAMSGTGRFLSGVGKYTKEGLQQVQKMSQQSEPRRYKHKKRSRESDDDELTFG